MTYLLKPISPSLLVQSSKHISSFSTFLQLHCYYLGPSRRATSEIEISTLTSLLLCLGPPIHFPHRGQSYLLNINLILSLLCLKSINGSICTQNKLQPPSPCPPPAGPGPWVPLQHQLTAPTLHHAQACYPSVSSYNMPISFYPQVLYLQSIKS